MKRIEWVDHLKAMGIFLVVYGHSPPSVSGVEKWIYSFHMPLFFLISGYLLKRPTDLRGIADGILQQVKSLAPPYLIHALFGFAFWYVIGRKFGADRLQDSSPLWTFLTIPYGTGTPEGIHLQPIVLWFFPCLFLCQAYLLSVSLLRDRIVWLLSILLATVGFLLPTTLALPFELETALVTQLFVTIGYMAKKNQWMERVSSCGVLLPSVLILLGSGLAAMNERVDVRNSHFGNPFLFLAAALSICFGLALLASKEPPHWISKYLSDNAILIFPLHVTVFSFFAAFYVYVLRLDLSVRQNPIVELTASVVNCALIAFVAAPICRKWFPWVYGLKPQKPVPNLVPQPAPVMGMSQVHPAEAA
jgi:acyltransferase